MILFSLLQPGRSIATRTARACRGPAVFLRLFPEYSLDSYDARPDPKTGAGIFCLLTANGVSDRQRCIAYLPGVCYLQDDRLLPGRYCHRGTAWPDLLELWDDQDDWATGVCIT